MRTFVPILSYYMLNNKTIETDIHEKSILYTFDLNSIHIDTVSGFKTLIFEEIPDTDKIHVKMAGIDAKIDIDGTLKALHFIPLKATKVEIVGLDIDFVIESTSTDNVHWAIVETSKISFDNFVITMKNSFLQKLVNMSSKIIDKVIEDMMPKLSKAIDA